MRTTRHQSVTQTRRRRLSSLVNGKQVTLRAQRANSYTKDNRAIRHVFVNGTNVSQLMLKEGYGMPIIFTENNEYDYAADYVTAFWEANRAGVGIHNPNLCGAGPRADFPITMSTNGDADGAEESNLNGEYVRLRNHGTTPFDLTGWQWKDSALEFYNFPVRYPDFTRRCTHHSHRAGHQYRNRPVLREDLVDLLRDRRSVPSRSSA